MKVLVTGATGFIGRHVVPELLKRSHQVVALGRLKEKFSRFSWCGKVTFIPWDIHSSDRFDLNVVENPGALLHLAWSGLPNYKSLFHFETNLPADFRFIKSLVDQGISQVLVTGTCFEYGMQNGCLNESMITHPGNPYALAKDSLRKFLQSLQQEVPFVLQWARLFYMYGNGQNPNSILAQLDEAMERGDSTFNMSGGEQLRDYLPVEEVARLLVRLIECPNADGIFNVCSGQPISIRHLVEQHLNSRKVAMQLNLGYYPYPDYEPMSFWGDRNRLDAVPGIS